MGIKKGNFLDRVSFKEKVDTKFLETEIKIKALHGKRNGIKKETSII